MSRVAIISSNLTAVDLTAPRPGRGAADAARLAELAAALAAVDHEVRLYARGPAGPATALADGVTLVAVPTPPAGQVEAVVAGWLAAHWSAGAWVPDVVHALGGPAGRAAVGPAHDCGATVVQSVYGLATPDGAARGRVSRTVGRLADRVVVSSQAECETLVGWGVPRGHVSVVPPGVDPVRFHPAGPVAPRGVDTPRLLVVGRPGADHGHADLAAALRWIPAAECVAVGAEGEDARWLETVARAAGVEDRFVALPAVPPGDLPAWYRSADLVLCPSRTMGRHAPALEAMASGVPVVATAVGGLADAVVDGLTGDLVPAGAPRALGAAARRLLRDDVRRMAYATAGLDRARHCYSWSRCATQLAGVYAQAAGRRSTVDA
ncbi:glycosyl transferase [Pilimelia terevasa]|uniref:Glycosyl transferase n=1 Tax=Pilimelia terevasa TaxID=53372 RepID=A0A8J3BQ97_9ACTN|nr:glycosyltransferase family 4 protein [Pilimelia terevasa]GGK25684.1 glycosyl transferase [Pilimelia terevasa]